MNILNLFYTQNPFYGKQVVTINLCCLFLFWVSSSEVITPKRMRIFLWVIVGTGLAVSAETLCQHYLMRGIILPWVKGGQAIGTIGNTNYLGAYLLFPVFASLALGKYARLLIFPFFVWILFISRARASWLGFGIGFALWLYWSVPRKAFAASVLWGILGLIVAFTWFPDSSQRWAETNTIRYRVKYWQASLELLKENPLFGTGMASYRNKVYDAQAKLGSRDPSYWRGYNEPKPRRAHNDYLESLNDGGFLYAAAFWGFIVYIMLKAYRKGLNGMAKAVFCGQVALLGSALFFFPFKLIDTSTLFFVQLGVLCSSESQ